MSHVVASADVVLGDPRRWLADPTNAGTPIAVECWIFDPEGSHVLLVEHRWRGWVPPGGAVEAGEGPRDAALRELFEETGVVADLSPAPVLACLRSYRGDWEPSLSFTFAAVSDRGDLRGERGQPCAWTRLGHVWTSIFPEDRARMRTFLASRS
ncbi:MAG: NUDIX hydrolase [Cellulomonadaceae bacterium]|nr:NUDIX hydrolase [Cellulomonadaceae bacterium]